jgi:hypothetical protein
MTVATPGDSSVTRYDPNEFGADTGLEDIAASDLMIPRLRIEHAEGTFKDSLSNISYGTLKIVLFGLVKQRVMWDSDVDEGDMPLCKSPDFEHGFPNMNPDIKKDKQFPWAKSNFSPSDARVIELAPGESKAHPNGWSSNGMPVLTCSACIFAQWDKGDWKVPPCSEQHTYPLLYSTDGSPSPNEGQWSPALLTVQKTGIKPSRQYIGSFAAAGNPMFTVYTELGLTLQSRGSVRYSVPTFKKLEPTDRNDWADFAARQRQIRAFIRSAPRRMDDDAAPTPAAPTDNENRAPGTVPATPAATPAESKAPTQPTPAAPVDDDDDMPF